MSTFVLALLALPTLACGLLMIAPTKAPAKAPAKAAAKPVVKAERILTRTPAAPALLLQDECPELANWFAQWPSRRDQWSPNQGPASCNNTVFAPSGAWEIPSLRAHFVRLSTGIALDVMTHARRKQGWK